MIIVKYYQTFIAVVGNREIFSKTHINSLCFSMFFVVFARHNDISRVLLGSLMLSALVASTIMYKHYSSLSTLSPTIARVEPPGRFSHRVGHDKVGRGTMSRKTYGLSSDRRTDNTSSEEKLIARAAPMYYLVVII